jgi:hypothetical protein
MRKCTGISIKYDAILFADVHYNVSNLNGEKHHVDPGIGVKSCFAVNLAAQETVPTSVLR